jgi:Protein of unknown function (DUF2970)
MSEDQRANSKASTGVSLWRTVKAVAWSFVGLRGRKGYEQDLKNLNPLHIIVVGFAGVFVFVGALIVLVNWLVKG